MRLVLEIYQKILLTNETFSLIKMKILDLFSGTGSVSFQAEKLGYEVVSLDISNQYHEPTILIDIMEWKYESIPSNTFDVIWASPPCQTFSVVNRLHYTKEEQQQRIEKYGLPLLRKTQEIINYFQPSLWIIENPCGMMKDYLEHQPYIIDYCRYADFGYRKRTHIWTNHHCFQPLQCQKKCSSMEGNRHKKQITWTRGISMQERYRVPYTLIKELLGDSV